MRDFGLPDIGGTRALRQGVAPVERVSAVRRPADEAVAAEAMSAISKPDAGDDAPVDADRVAAIRSAIEAGTYRLAPDEIAEGIIGSGLFKSAGE